MVFDMSNGESFGCDLSILDERAISPELQTIDIVCQPLHTKNMGERIIRIKNGDNITIGDVLKSIHDFLYEQVPLHEWNKLEDDERREIEVAYRRRAESGLMSGRTTPVDDDGAMPTCLRKIDWLVGKTNFLGLTPSENSDTRWLMNMA